MSKKICMNATRNWFITMDWINGRTLAAIGKDHAISGPRVRDIKERCLLKSTGIIFDEDGIWFIKPRLYRDNYIEAINNILEKEQVK